MLRPEEVSVPPPDTWQPSPEASAVPYATIEFSTLRWPLKFDARLPPLPLFPLAVLPTTVTLLSAVAPPLELMPPPNAAAKGPSPSASLFTIVVLTTLRGPSSWEMPPP